LYVFSPYVRIFFTYFYVFWSNIIFLSRDSVSNFSFAFHPFLLRFLSRYRSAFRTVILTTQETHVHVKHRPNVTSLVHNDVYVETGTARRDVADQSLVKNYAIAGQEDVTRALGGSQRCHRTCVRERSKSTVLDIVHSLCRTIRSIKPNDRILFVICFQDTRISFTMNRSERILHLNATAKPIDRVADIQSRYPSNDHVFLATALATGMHFLATHITVIVVQTRS